MRWLRIDKIGKDCFINVIQAIVSVIIFRKVTNIEVIFLLNTAFLLHHNYVDCFRDIPALTDYFVDCMSGISMKLAYDVDHVKLTGVYVMIL